MITFQVIDCAGFGPVLYNMQVECRTLTIDDDFKIEKYGSGLKIIEAGRVHKFNEQGYYIGTHSIE